VVSPQPGIAGLASARSSRRCQPRATGANAKAPAGPTRSIRPVNLASSASADSGFATAHAARMTDGEVAAVSTSTDTVSGRFAGKTAIVTGAGSGIGRATALRLAREGATVVAADISDARLGELAAGNPDLALIPVTADIATGDGVAAVAARAGGRVDALANVAGIMDGFLPPAEIDDQTWERVFAVNVTSMMRMTRAVLPIMLAAGGGAIVNVSSEASLRGSAAGVAYTASKHAVNGLTKSTAFFHSQGIRANAVVPGGVLTNIEGAFRSEQAAAIVGPVLQATLPSVATAEQVAAAITFLLSGDAANINGAILPCDGGWSAI